MSFELFLKAQRIDLQQIEVEGVSRATCKLVLLVMAGLADPYCYATVSTLARETCLNRKAIFRALAALESAKLIEDSGERIGKTKQVTVWKLLTTDPQSGTVPNGEQYPIIRESVPNNPGNRSQSGICNLRFNQEFKKRGAPGFLANSREAIKGAK